MHRRKLRPTAGGLALGAALALVPVAWAGAPPEEFSADLIQRNATGAQLALAHLYVSHGRVRLETPEASAGYFLIDGELGSTLFVRPAQQVFMDARASSALTQVFVPVDPSDPCRSWRTAAENAGVTDGGAGFHCERTPAADRGAAHTIGYRLAVAGEASERWFDTELGFPVGYRLSDGTSTRLEHLRRAPQPQELFVIPAGYRASDPRALIERIKHSDVWAE
jgi:hypothetical protein